MGTLVLLLVFGPVIVVGLCGEYGKDQIGESSLVMRPKVVDPKKNKQNLRCVYLSVSYMRKSRPKKVHTSLTCLYRHNCSENVVTGQLFL